MVEIRPFHSADYDEVTTLWSHTEGLTLREADSREAIASYLARNPGLSFVAREDGRLVGAVLAGTDDDGRQVGEVSGTGASQQTERWLRRLGYTPD
jgi:ribosomal protein S18 acetylase RimI-like enzyme